VDGGLSGKDVTSTITLLLYLYNSFSTPTFLILFSMQIAVSKNARDTYRFLLKLREKGDWFWEVVYVVAQLSAVIGLEYALWVKNLYATPMTSRDDL
jgi:hypothetical protein